MFMTVNLWRKSTKIVRDIYLLDNTYSSQTIGVDLRHTFSVIHMNEMNVFDQYLTNRNRRVIHIYNEIFYKYL